jgi:hypothetical protein
MSEHDDLDGLWFQYEKDGVIHRRPLTSEEARGVLEARTAIGHGAGEPLVGEQGELIEEHGRVIEEHPTSGWHPRDEDASA